MKRRLMAAATGLMLAVLWVAPAHAFSAPAFVAPSPSAASTVNGAVGIKVEAKPDSLPILGIGLEKVFIEVTVSGPGAPGSLGKREGSPYSATWNVDPNYNGTYEIKAIATSSNSNADPKVASISGLKVNNPPATPTGVKAAIVDGVPSISWSANPEKDITGYKVLRSVDGGQPSMIYGGTATAAKDTNAPHSSSLTYRVVASRKGAAAGSVLESGASPATSSLTVAAPPEPVAPADPGAVDPNNPTVPGTNIVTGKETPKAPVPATNSNFGKAVAPIVKAGPAGTAFDETLPYSGVPPEQFESASGSDPEPFDSSLAGEGDGVTVTNPLKFILGGVVLMVAAFFMWRTSRKLLKGTRPEDQKPPTAVAFPDFRINRG